MTLHENIASSVQNIVGAGAASAKGWPICSNEEDMYEGEYLHCSLHLPPDYTGIFSIC